MQEEKNEDSILEQHRKYRAYGLSLIHICLSDPQNPHQLYDLLGVMKAELVGKIYVPATDECLPFAELVKLADEVGAILCYPYLGDVTDSVTGDKKAAKFEDDFLDELFEMLKEEGVHGVTYMPARNTREQLTSCLLYTSRKLPDSRTLGKSAVF